MRPPVGLESLSSFGASNRRSSKCKSHCCEGVPCTGSASFHSFTTSLSAASGSDRSGVASIQQLHGFVPTLLPCLLASVRAPEA